MAITTTITDPVAESSSAQIVADIVDETGAAVLLANINTMTLTLYLVGAETIINTKNDTNILNINGGVIADGGTPLKTTLTLTLAPADNAMIGTGPDEKHLALIEWTYSAGTKGGWHEVVYTVVNMSKVN